MKRLTFSKQKRLVNNKQFKDILAFGRCVRDELLILYMARNDYGYPRLGISVGKAHGKATERNRLKRLLREAFRQNQDKIPNGYDYLLMIRPTQKVERKPTFEQIRSSFLTLVESAKAKLESP